MNKQKLLYTTFLKAKIITCNQVDSRLNPYPQYYLEFEDDCKIKAYPSEKFNMWLKRNKLDSNTYYIFNGQFRTVRDAIYEQDSLVVNPLLGIELDAAESNFQMEMKIPIRIFKVYKDQQQYNTENFVLASVKNLNEPYKSDRKFEFPIKLCFDKNHLSTKYPDIQMVSKEGWATVVRNKYNLVMVDFNEIKQ